MLNRCCLDYFPSFSHTAELSAPCLTEKQKCRIRGEKKKNRKKKKKKKQMHYNTIKERRQKPNLHSQNVSHLLSTFAKAHPNTHSETGSPKPKQIKIYKVSQLYSKSRDRKEKENRQT